MKKYDLEFAATRRDKTRLTKNERMNKMNFKVNNGMILDIKQDTADGEVTVSRQDCAKIDAQYKISAGDFVMLLNYYQYIKRNDIHCSFINPYGKN